MTTFTCTYSPDDDKIRLYASSRLDKELYERVKGAGFRWAPKQDLFFVVWNPRAEDLAIELAGEIEDDDKTLADRAEERAERFEGYQGKRAAEADRAKNAVSAIADNIPFGQPILIGHHSERAARRDAEKIENGMRKAIRLWETSEYWESRAKGALAHAKYKELPAVRARRIKTIEADLRRKQREQADAQKWLRLWTQDGLTIDKARIIAGACHLGVERKADSSFYWSAYDALQPDGERYSACPAYTVEMVQEKAKLAYPRTVARAQRWIDHYQHRLTYEKAMLNEQGASQLLAPKPRPTQLPLANYRGENGNVIAENRYHRGQLDTMRQVDMTAAEYAAIYADYKGTIIVEGSHRVRMTLVKHERVAVFITDSKTHEKPAPAEKKELAPPPIRIPRDPPAPKPERSDFDAMKDTLKAGVQIATAPELFVTPSDLAERMAELADIKPSHRVLEPSAGTGSLLKAIGDGPDKVAVEINQNLAAGLSRLGVSDLRIHQGDFLECTPDQLGKFDRIIMNPPFSGQADIEHVQHGLKFLKPGGRLVAIMSAGVSFRQDRKATGFRATVEDHGGTVEPLPDDSFKEAGTGVRTVLVSLSLPPARPDIKPTIYSKQTSIFD